MRLSRPYIILALFFVFCPPVFAAQKAPGRELKLGFIHASPVGDAGWSYAHDLARIRLASKPGIKTYFVENVPEGPESEREIRNMSRKGYDIIVLTSLGFMDPALKVAKDFPHIVYLHCSGDKTASNVSAFFGRMYEPRYLTGLVAGKMTKSNIIGFVAAFPVPEVFRGINAFTLGVREVNPTAEVRVEWSHTWYNPNLEKALAGKLLDQGADVIAQHQDSPAPQEAAQERGVYSIGYNFDMSPFAPKAHLVASVFDWTPFYDDAVAKVREGVWESGSFWPGMGSGVVDISPFGPMVPVDVRALVQERRKAIMDGTFNVFQGPLLDQSGMLRVVDGVGMTDSELRAMDWFVQGVSAAQP